MVDGGHLVGINIAFGFGILNEQKGTSAIEIQNIRWRDLWVEEGTNVKCVVDMAFKKQTEKKKEKKEEG
jgi:hypothetical protein